MQSFRNSDAYRPKRNEWRGVRVVRCRSVADCWLVRQCLECSRVLVALRVVEMAAAAAAAANGFVAKPFSSPCCPMSFFSLMPDVASSTQRCLGFPDGNDFVLSLLPSVVFFVMFCCPLSAAACCWTLDSLLLYLAMHHTASGIASACVNWTRLG